MKNSFIGMIAISLMVYYNLDSPLGKFKDGTYIEITFENFKVLEENNIGDDWNYKSNIDDQILTIGASKVFDLTGKYEFIIQSEAIEEDPSHDDIGRSFTKITPENIETFVEGKQVVELVNVKEYHGKGRGNTAICRFIYRIDKVE